MVSGLVISPWDHERIFSGEANPIRIDSKFFRSWLLSIWSRNILKVANLLVAKYAGWIYIFNLLTNLTVLEFKLLLLWHFSFISFSKFSWNPGKDSFRLFKGIRFSAQAFLGFFHKFNVQGERLKFSYQDIKGLRNSRTVGRFTLNNWLIDFGSTLYVIRFGCQKLL